MRTHFFWSQRLKSRKKDRRISFIKHDLASALTLPTPQNGLFAGNLVVRETTVSRACPTIRQVAPDETSDIAPTYRLLG